MNIIDHIFMDVNAGLLDSAFKFRGELNNQIMQILNIDNLDPSNPTDAPIIESLRRAIIIGNATYNNSSCSITPIDDGVWDLMVERYRKLTPDDSYPVGFKPTDIVTDDSVAETTKPKVKLFSHLMDEEIKYMQNMIYSEDILDPNYIIGSGNIVKNLFTKTGGYITKRMADIPHNHPDLVGTFDKCKFVLNSQAREAGVENDPSVRIMERDFFKPLLDKGIIDYGSTFAMIATLKYDGISVEADVCDRVISARTRGDALGDKATDITPILGGYRFPKTPPGWNNNETIGMKFEAIINNFNLNKLNIEKDKQYKNCRTAMISITGSSDGFKYRDLITLVPISTDYRDSIGDPLDRLVEIEMLNSLFTRDQLLRYSVLTGDYPTMLFNIKRFVEEAEFARSYLPFMYDGVVFEFYDRNIREKLGRDNAMDRYKCAIKFNPMTKETIFRGYYYTVGQDGTITPMITYDPVEFFGTIHPNSSGHSYQNFKKLDLHVGDIIEVTYRNDVITYVTKPDNEHNRNNAKNPYTEKDSFPKICPYCGSKIEISKSEKSARCPNFECPERTVQRLTESLSKLGVVNFGEETVRALQFKRLWQFFDADVKDLAILGENNKVNLKLQLNNIMATKTYDYKLFGALGFNNIGEKTWQTIFSNIHVKDLVERINDGSLTPDNFPSIKGIGPATIKTIFDEWGYFLSDIGFLFIRFNMHKSYGIAAKKQIRFTGCRDSRLEAQLVAMGYDCSGKSGITKSTDILLIPYEGYNEGSKISKALKYGTCILPIQDFIDNMDQYL